jgi:uncharacterized protein (UPF0332 family)
MKYDELLNSRRIRKEKVSRVEVGRALERAERDLQTARTLIERDRDWSFAVAYDAVLQASRAYMFAQGFRPSSSESHKNTFAFMRLAMGKDYEELMAYFDRMRNKRHQAIYETAGLITETEAYNILEKAESFVVLIREELKKVTDASS